MPLHWHYKPTEPFVPQGKETTRLTFAREERSGVGILIREALQNALDARRDDEIVRVSLRSLAPGEFDADYLDTVFDETLRSRLLVASNVQLPPAEHSSVLVIEDFGTKGLLGDATDFNADGPDQNWNAFWHREGEGAKSGASNGGAGQGKVTYFAHSLASVVLGLTVRSDDLRRLLMGRAALERDYKFSDGKKYLRAHYWTTSDENPAPEDDDVQLDRFSKAFCLSRGASSPGLSLVIPFSKPIEEAEAIRSVILDFYMPIAAGRLEVLVGDTELTADTIDEIANRDVPDSEVAIASSSFTKSFRAFARGILADQSTQATLKPGWNKDRVIPEDAFPDATLASMRATLDSGGRVAISLPLEIKRKGNKSVLTEFKVFVEVPPDLKRNEEAFIRMDLLIGAESHVASGTFVQNTRSLVWIQNRDLSDFLLTAEEPTHLKWNASRAREKGDFTSPDLILRSIRQAVPRLLAILLGGVTKKDFKALARYFSKPSKEPSKPGKDSPGKKDDDRNPPPPPPPPSAPKPFKIESQGSTIRVMANGAGRLESLKFPFDAELELAYEGLDQDPFSEYDPYDFDVAQLDTHPILAQGVSVESRAANTVCMRIWQPEFSLEIGGFDPNVRLRARLKYDITDATDEAEEENIDG